jgi:hypothetical protein
VVCVSKTLALFDTFSPLCLAVESLHRDGRSSLPNRNAKTDISRRANCVSRYGQASLLGAFRQLLEYQAGRVALAGVKFEVRGNDVVGIAVFVFWGAGCVEFADTEAKPGRKDQLLIVVTGFIGKRRAAALPALEVDDFGFGLVCQMKLDGSLFAVVHELAKLKAVDCDVANPQDFNLHVTDCGSGFGLFPGGFANGGGGRQFARASNGQHEQGKESAA